MFETLERFLTLYTEQNPYAGGGPVVGKVLIVCPVTLVNVCPQASCMTRSPVNCPAELDKRVHQMVTVISPPPYGADSMYRLGRDRLGIMCGDKDKGRLKQFINSCAHAYCS